MCISMIMYMYVSIANQESVAENRADIIEELWKNLIIVNVKVSLMTRVTLVFHMEL